jgi:hypothetical protein
MRALAEKRLVGMKPEANDVGGAARGIENYVQIMPLSSLTYLDSVGGR